MGARPTKITTNLRPDDAHQAANTTFDTQDRQYIDAQIRGCQQHLADSLINGVIGTWARVASTSSELANGDVVCLAGVASGEPTVTLATAAAIAGPGAAYGVVLRAASPGARVLLAIDGILAPSITGLGTTAGLVRVSSVGRPERVASYSSGDYPLGSVNSLGYLTLNRSTAVGTTGVSSPEAVAPTPDTLAMRGSAGEVRAARVETPTVRTTEDGDITLQHGTTTFARIRSTEECEQPGDFRLDATSGQLLTYLAGSEVSAFQQKIRWLKTEADSSASDTVSFPILEAPGYFWTIRSVTFTPNDNLAPDADDYAGFRIVIKESGGGLIGYAATGLTTPSGTNSVGGFAEGTPVSLVLDPFFQALPIYGLHYAELEIYKAGSGATVPAGVMTMTIAPWLGPLP